ncbi:DNA polymerase III subunit gamma/tau [Shewanella corallii]|uniref:DNA-directed DNA polymerase n=1 Tax=Shewanella corallii TaxID=560080 RepID=A0ABT0NC38_9GAMM|nr:DNA polymerase III subunit gamma/tau [Shewanella corallii]MCL2915670.1 DNA polymerase III subunit gamma/tau [Shewanella corallii]
MSYQVLARKWRPANFDQVVGQSHVLHALTNALSQQRLHHAYLFTGTRGVGKTSLARLFAKGLNCETGVTANPCGKCPSCVEIAEGRFVDLIEVDAASRTKVDDTRELLDNVQYRPTRGRFKVYLIDEVHMLSRSSFNALLKTLEEPPEHVKFLLATTDPQKLPVTVLSRCLQFNLKSLTQDDIAGQLNHVLTQEQLPFEPQALTLLAKSANGSMRDALSLTDQAIAFGAGQVMLQQVQTMLGTIDEQQVVALLDALLKGDVAHLMHLTAQILSYGADADEVLRSLLELLHQVTLTQFAPAAAQMSLYSDQIKQFASVLKPEQIQLYYQILLTGRKDLPHAPDPKSGLEMALLRAIAFLPESVAGHWTPAQGGGDTPGKAEPAGGATGTEGSETLTSAATVQPPSSTESTAPEKLDESPAKELESQPRAQVVAQTPVIPESRELSNPDASQEIEQADDSDDEEDALLAEQTLLLSQAESMGYANAQAPSDLPGESDSDESEPVGPAPIAAEFRAPESGTNVTPAKPVVQKESALYSVDERSQTTADTQAANVQVKDKQGDAETTGDIPATESVTPAATADTVSDSSEPQFGPPSFGEDDLSSYEQYFTGDSDGEDTQDMSGLMFEPATPVPAAPVVTPPAAKPLDDDFLDAVLAARDLLMSGLGGEESQEETPGVKVAGPGSTDKKPNAPETQTDEKLSEPRDVLESTEESAGADTAGDQVLTGTTDNQPQQVALQPEAPKPQPEVSQAEEVSQAKEDRPPWEESQAVAAMPPPSDSFSAEFMADDADDTESDNADTNVMAAESAMAQVQFSHDEAQQSAEQQGVTKAEEIAPEQSCDAEAGIMLPAELLPVTGNELDLHWYKQMSGLKIGGRVRQLAVNSICMEWGDQIDLLLKPDQKHLAAASAVEQLRVALVELAGRELTLQIQVGSDPQRETPREVRARFHLELLQQARSSLVSDENIRWLSSFMGAQLDEDSVAYPQDLLALRGRGIQGLTSA